MMTIILILAFVMIAFVGLLRYDVHKHKYSPEALAKLEAEAKALADETKNSKK
jgi:hypothetical protein